MKIDKDIFDNGVELEAQVKYEFIRWIQVLQLNMYAMQLKTVKDLIFAFTLSITRVSWR
jgi:hypothetical protein